MLAARLDSLGHGSEFGGFLYPDKPVWLTLNEKNGEAVSSPGRVFFSWLRSEIAVSRSVTCFWWIKSSRIAQGHPSAGMIYWSREGSKGMLVLSARHQRDPMTEPVLSADHLFSREIIWFIGWSKRQGADA